jgi:CO/xanthine dehydrogenase Mo-binding subunit
METKEKKEKKDEPKGIGELPFSTVPAAYVQAVSQALDHPFEKLPVCAEDIWEAVR